MPDALAGDYRAVVSRPHAAGRAGRRAVGLNGLAAPWGGQAVKAPLFSDRR